MPDADVSNGSGHKNFDPVDLVYELMSESHEEICGDPNSSSVDIQYGHTGLTQNSRSLKTTRIMAPSSGKGSRIFLIYAGQSSIHCNRGKI